MRIMSLPETGMGETEFIELINKLLPYDFIDPETYRRVTIHDPNHKSENTFIFYEGGEPVGVAILVYLEKIVVEQYRDHIWLKLLAITDKEEGAGEKIIEWIEDWARSMGKQILHVYGYAPFYYTPGVDDRYHHINNLLRGRGYHVESRIVNYYIDMYNYEPPPTLGEEIEKLEGEGYRFTEATDEMYPKLLEWIREEFGLPWMIEASITKHYPSSGIVIATRPDGSIAGFNVYSATSPRRIGPIGVSKNLRSKGIGRILLHLGLLKMKRLGKLVVEIPWTTHLFFYAGVPGINRIRYFRIYGKKLS